MKKNILLAPGKMFLNWNFIRVNTWTSIASYRYLIAMSNLLFILKNYEIASYQDDNTLYVVFESRSEVIKSLE